MLRCLVLFAFAVVPPSATAQTVPLALTPACDVPEIAACLGCDLWNYRDRAGRGLRSATDFLATYRGNIAAWPYREIRPEPGELDALLTRANWAWGPASYPQVMPPASFALQYRASR